MEEILIRFVIGGAVVSVFSMIGDLFRPRSFGGLFGAAPSIALATLTLTVHKDGPQFASVEGRSMVIGALGLLVYSFAVSKLLMQGRYSVLKAAAGTLTLWFACALGLWFVLLRNS